MPVPAKAKDNKPISARALETVLIKNDLSKLSDEQRLDYYKAVCKSLGLNPLTQPFAYITLSGRLTLYAKRDCTDQLRKIHGISVEIVDREIADGLMIVHAKATDKKGRADEDYGAVAAKPGATEIFANSLLKATTKAKRRVTLSICGLGMLDETEIPAEASVAGERISQKQLDDLIELADRVAADKRAFVEFLQKRWNIDLPSLAHIPVDLLADAIAQLERKAEKTDAAENEATTAEAEAT